MNSGFTARLAMKYNKIKKTASLFLAAVLFLSLAPYQADGAVSDWFQKGASINPRWNTDFDSDTFRQSVSDLRATGANFVTLIIPIYQSNIHTTDLAPGWNTPTDESLISGINHIHSLGMNVDLKIHPESNDGNWRAHINPGDREGWFTNYGNFLEHYARIAQSTGVEQMTIGSELINMSSDRLNQTNTSNWIELINRVRGVYSGRLTYSANWGEGDFADEKNQIEFWTNLDAIGIAAYFNLPSPDPSVESIRREWDRWIEDISALQSRFGKPVIFTEIGYRSRNGARHAPWDYFTFTSPDQSEQANLYKALFSYWNNIGYMTGVNWWDWISDPSAGGDGTQTYTPQNKTAEEVMSRWFGSPPPPGTEPPPPPPTDAEETYSISGSITPSEPVSGQESTVTVSVTNNNGSVSDKIVDIEIYNSIGQQIHQQVYEPETFGAGESRIFSFPWTPGSPEEYVLKTGIFSSGWSSLNFWDDEVHRFRVTGSMTPPPPGESEGMIEIWWPTDGATVSGTQPFKAMLQGMAITEYEMLWQVDGGTLNPMYDSYADYPHKEAIVDLSGWTWKNSGPYELNFVSKRNGSTIAERAVNIFVSH